MFHQLRSIAAVAATVAMLATGIGAAVADTIQTMPAKPLAQADVLQGATLKPVQAGPLKVPTITWGADVSTIYTYSSGLFKTEGLDVQLFHEDDFAKQVRGVLDGNTPFLRGTFGMINSAEELFHQRGTDLVVLGQLSWSRGGDALVVRPGIASLSDLKGKTIALQLYGPHMDLLTTVLNRAGLSLSDVHIRWFKELSVPTYDTHGKAVDARSAFMADPSIDAAFVISPDADALTDKGTGSGAEGVKGASVLFTTKSADHVIADVYAVRADWFNAHKDLAMKFEHALMLGQEKFGAFYADRANQKSAYSKLMTDSAVLLLGSPDATADVDGLLDGALEFVDFSGNVAFFTGNGTTRNFNVLTSEIQQSFIQIGLMTATAPIQNANWDYTKLAAGLAHADLTMVPRQTFDAAKVTAAVQQKIATDAKSWEDQGTLYEFEIHFEPNQATFSEAQYAAAFKKVLDLSQTFGGAIVTVEGHADPVLLNQARDYGQTSRANQLEANLQGLSVNRANAVREAYLRYTKGQKIQVDPSQLIAVGMGATHAMYPRPSGDAQSAANRRVVFRVKNVETESDQFEAPK